MFRLLLVVLLMNSCKSRDAQPELRDPIFADLVKQLETQERKVESLKKDLSVAKSDLSLADPQNGEATVRRQTVFDMSTKLDLEGQKARFLEIQVESRREFARKSYNKAFDKGEEWPQSEEYHLYQVNQKLLTAPRSYDETHRARLQGRAPASSGTGSKPKH